MAVNTILADIKLNSLDIKNDGIYIVNAIQAILEGYFSQLQLILSQELSDCVCKIYLCNNAGTVNMKIYNDGLVTLVIDHRGDELDWMVSSKNLEADIYSGLKNLEKCSVFCPIKRGLFMRYLYTTDDRLIEYDIDQLVFEAKTPYQRVQILHSRTLGNMLVLDGLQNLAESDLIYTETLMARGKEDYKDKEILILGGGDGALLYELLKEHPKEVLMVEIDEVVMDACSRYMSTVCGDVLQTKNGPNYEIIVADCKSTLSKFVEENRKFDYIFSDLTDIPISETPQGEMWDFINQTLTTCFKIMKPHGKFMTHLTAAVMEDALKMYEEQVLALNPNIILTKSKAYVPSFYEEWTFAQVRLKSA